MSPLWIIVTQIGEARVLASKVKDNSGQASALVIGAREVAEDAAYSVSRVAWIDAGDLPAETFAQNACAILQKEHAQVVLGYATPGVRAALGLYAQASDAACVSNIIDYSIEGEAVNADRLIIDNKVVESVTMPIPACLIADTMTFQPEEADTTASPAAITQDDATPNTSCDIISTDAIPDSGLESAKRVVGVGRGVNTPEKFALTQQLAEALDAELGGSMPGVQDFGHFPADAHYIGLTGVSLNSELYVAVGISGSTPHLAGIQNAGKVVCINSDPNAQLFSHADYGVVADLQEAIPAFIRALA